MSNTKKLIQAAAGAAGGEALNVEDVFSTYLLDNSGTITNGIDLAGEGGLLWTKWRSGGALSFYQNHFLYDTERGYGSTDYLHSNNTDAAGATGAIGSGSFNSDGFTTGGNIFSGNEWASWTFRKAPKFFDVVTWTGDGTGARTISHNLGATVGALFMKATNASMQWFSYHNGLTNGQFLELNATTAAVSSVNAWNNTTPTSTQFSVGSYGNVSGRTYVAYLFAHNNGDGEFGSTADQDIIKCGSYSGDGTTDGSNEINTGFEPQWLLIKNTTSADNWVIMDNMRGLVNGGGAVGADAQLYPNTSGSEGGFDFAHPTATGFALTSSSGNVNQSSQTYIYIAIRRGPMAVPESATDVFDVAFGSNTAEPWFKSGFVTDMGFLKNRSSTGNWAITSRLTQGTDLNITSSAESPNSSAMFDYQNGYYANFGTSTSFLAWMWKRAPNFFDVVAYTGDGVAGRTVSHNLGVAPEMIWVKRRNDADNWIVYHSGFNLDGDNAPETDYGVLDNGNHFDGTLWNDTAPTATEFTVGFQGAVNDTFNNSYIAYLFASLDNVSKLGTYTGNGTSQTIDCGFSSGARFVLIKRSDSGGYGSDWYVWDTERGIVAGNDPHLSLNTTAAEVTTDDSIDPVSSGFAVNQVSATNINVSSATYIFYAIA